jgi:hypothetical protein
MAALAAIAVVILLGIGGIWLLTSGGDTVGPATTSSTVPATSPSSEPSTDTPTPPEPTTPKTATPKTATPKTATELELRSYMRGVGDPTLVAGQATELTARVWDEAGSTKGGTATVTPSAGLQIRGARPTGEGAGSCQIDDRGHAICAFGRLQTDDTADFTILVLASEPGTTVSLRVSATTHEGIDAQPQRRDYTVVGQQPCTREVPNLVGERVADAASLLRDRDLVPRPVPGAGEGPPGTVIEQDPEPGESAPCGSTVTIHVVPEEDQGFEEGQAPEEDQAPEDGLGPEGNASAEPGLEPTR